MLCNSKLLLGTVLDRFLCLKWHMSKNTYVILENCIESIMTVIDLKNKLRNSLVVTQIV